MKEYTVTLEDKITYTMGANTQQEVINKALEYWEHRTPIIDIREKKKVKKTIHYSVKQYYKQDVLVDEGLDEDDIIELWENDKIETLNEPVADGDGIYLDEEGTWAT